MCELTKFVLVPMGGGGGGEIKKKKETRTCSDVGVTSP